jgi:dihydroorotate dehydrogenase
MTLFSLIRPVLFRIDPERAHGLTVQSLSYMPKWLTPKPDPRLGIKLSGLHFPSPLGLAAGFDKDGRVPLQALALGFGAVEVGTLTPKAQSGNPRPRLFRLAEDRAVINRMGFNNGGQIDAYPRLKRAFMEKAGVIGINIGANKDSTNRIADYAAGVARMSAVASYLTINISSPNTPGLRALQDESALTELLGAVREALGDQGPPVFLKVAPDLMPADIDAIARLTVGKMDALIVSNTTIMRPALYSRYAAEAGGLSGVPLKQLAQQRLIDFRKATGGNMPLIGVGGIETAEDAFARIKAGASLVQLYSALVYEGPGLARRINRGLAALLDRDGFASLADAVGIDVPVC